MKDMLIQQAVEPHMTLALALGCTVTRANCALASVAFMQGKENSHCSKHFFPNIASTCCISSSHNAALIKKTCLNC